jgi:hypothetical protein
MIQALAVIAVCCAVGWVIERELKQLPGWRQRIIVSAIIEARKQEAGCLCGIPNCQGHEADENGFISIPRESLPQFQRPTTIS